MEIIVIIIGIYFVVDVILFLFLDSYCAWYKFDLKDVFMPIIHLYVLYKFITLLDLDQLKQYFEEINKKFQEL